MATMPPLTNGELIIEDCGLLDHNLETGAVRLWSFRSKREYVTNIKVPLCSCRGWLGHGYCRHLDHDIAYDLAWWGRPIKHPCPEQDTEKADDFFDVPPLFTDAEMEADLRQAWEEHIRQALEAEDRVLRGGAR